MITSKLYMMKNNAFALIKSYIFLTVVFNIILFCSCEKINKDQLLTNKNSIMPKLIDTSFFECEELQTKWIITGSYKPLYIGEYKSEVKLNHRFFDRQNADEYFSYSRNNTIDFEKMNLDIFIDTSKFIYSDNLIWNDDYEEIKYKTIKSHPVILKNISNFTGMIGFGDQIPMILEAQDSTQNWRPIEKPFFYMCGTGLNYILLPPNEIVISATPIFKGEFNTFLRLKLGNNYSNKIKGNININQFESIFDERGNLKEK